MDPAAHECPGTAEIERFACGDAGTGESVAAHVRGCETCRARVEAARDDAMFVERVKSLAGGDLGPRGAPRIPGYRSVGVLNSGAQGVVYRGVQESTSREVAIKTLAPGQPVSRRQRLRAEREAEIAARLRHPHIVTVFESRTLEDGRVAVIMEYVDGVPLDAWSPPGATHAERHRALLRVFIGVCGAIHHAHLNGVIHRDLKPDNILVTGEGRPVVLDFGVAKAGGMRTTLTGEFAGTPAYASPEQVAGRPDDVDALTDVYSLGVILYRLVCGVMPYDIQGTIFDIARTIGEVAPVPPRTRVSGLPADLEAIILRALRKEKGQRYQSAAALARDLERYLAGDPVEARSGSGWYLLRKAVSLKRRQLAWAGAALLVLVGAGAVVAMSVRRASEAAGRAQREQEQARAENVRARAVTELLREALPNADPSRPDLSQSAGAGLSRLYFRLETGAFASDPDLDQALRRMWGGVYTGFGTGKASSLIEYAEVSLRNGLVRLRREHGARHADIASTMHELAGVLLVRKRGPEAEAMCRDALEMRRALLGPESLATASTRALLARVLFSRGRRAEGVAEADAAIAVFSRAGSGADVDSLVAPLLALKARAALDAGDAQQAEGLVREALTRRLRLLPPDDPELAESLVDLADLGAISPASATGAALREAWGPSAGEAVRADLPLLAQGDGQITSFASRPGRTDALGRLLRLQELLLGDHDPALVGTLISKMRAAQGEGRSLDKAEAALRAADILARHFGEDDSSVLVCVEEAAVTLALAGRGDRAVELGERAMRIRDAIPAGVRDPLLSASTSRHLAWYLSLAGRCEDSLPVWDRTITDLEGVFGAQHHVVALAQGGKAFSLAECGRLEQADELSARALATALALPATAGDQLAHIRFARGHVLHLLGRHAEAIDMFGPAWDVLYRQAAPEFAWRRIMIGDASASARTLGDAEAEALWRSRLDVAAER